MAETQIKWYREPMVWLVIAIPLAAVIVGGIMLTLAVETFDGLVEDDYYEKGKEINRVLARDEFALDNGIVADIRIEDRTGDIVVALESSSAYVFPEMMGLSMLHPTQSSKDIKLLLKLGPDGNYHSKLLRPIQKGRWYFRISAPDWRLQKLISWPESSEFRILPGD